VTDLYIKTAFGRLPGGAGVWWLAAIFAVLWAPMIHAADSSPRTVNCDGIKQTYFWLASKQDIAQPAIVLLHGAGDQAANMIEAWRHMAEKQKIVLLAPELPRDPKFENAAPGVFRCVVEDARHIAKIDPQRVYIFGNSMGGYLAYDAAMYQSKYFAAIAVHAMTIADEYASIVEIPKRKMPVAMYIGDHDQFFSVDSMLKTRNMLRKEDFPVHYVELVNHDHNYYDKSGEINADAWKFFKDIRLPAAEH
jgi:poly(3-hydroxybutyrate) depolymerase